VLREVPCQEGNEGRQFHFQSQGDRSAGVPRCELKRDILGKDTQREESAIKPLADSFTFERQKAYSDYILRCWHQGNRPINSECIGVSRHHHIVDIGSGYVYAQVEIIGSNID
jgi:hypothetical protein